MKKAIRCILFFLILLFLLSGVTEVLRVKEAGALPKTYFTENGSLDVIAAGPSMIQQGYYPMELWGSMGVTAYDLGSGNQTAMSSYYIIREAIERSHPKLVIFECGQLREEVIAMDTPYVHYLTDLMPALSYNRLLMIRDYARSGEADAQDTEGLLIPLSIYHRNWKSINEKSFNGKQNALTHGARVKTKVQKKVETHTEPEPDPGYELPAYSEHYLRAIIELCAANDTDLLLVTMPIPGAKKGEISRETYVKRVHAAAKVSEIAEEYGLVHLNLLSALDEIGIDAQHDTSDSHHLNIYGAMKFTAYLNDWMSSHYDLPDHRGDAAWADYAAEYELYRSYMDTKVETASS